MWKVFESWGLVLSASKMRQEMQADGLHTKIAKTFPEVDQRQRSAMFTIVASYFAPHFVFVCSILRGNKQELLEWCRVGHSIKQTRQLQF